MKIAIQTLVGHTNYGCILQAYALQTVLQRMGHEVVILNRRENYPSVKLFIYRIFSLIKCLYRIYILRDKRYVICNPLNQAYIVKRERLVDFSLMEQFVNKHLNLSPLFRSTRALKRYVNQQDFECYIVGSDQIWREIYTPNIYDSFLGYLSKENKAKKISYAASFGTISNPISVNKLTCCWWLAKRFDAISVREKSGIQLVKDLFGLSSIHVLDPTLLLEKCDYKSIINNEMLGKNKVVSYILDKTREKEDIIQTITESLSVENLNLTDYPLNKKGISQPFSVSQWLEAISNAKFVITDSFHGSVFSIIFKKPFIIIANKERGLERFTSLLDTLDLNSRLIYKLEDFLLKRDELLEMPNYEDVCNKFNMAKKCSMQFLTKQLNN